MMTGNGIKEQVEKYYRHFQRGTKLWSFAYHSCLYGTAAMTLTIGFITQIDFQGIACVSKDIFISFLGLLASILAMIIAKGGLDRKWRSNRISRGKTEILKLRLAMEKPDIESIERELEKIISSHDQAITSDRIELD